MDMSQYLQLFIEESKEHLQNLNANLLGLEKSPDDLITLNEIFRVAHTLKGMAGTMGFVKMSTLTHDMENVLQEIRSGKIKCNSQIIDVLFQCLDILESYVNSIIETGSEGERTNNEVLKLLNNIITSNVGVQQDSNEEPAPAPQEISEKKPEEDDGFVIDEYCQSIIDKATKMGFDAYKIKFVINQGCLLKSARAFIIFKTLERNADIIKSQPTVEDIEDEKFDFEFTVLIVTKASEEFLMKELNSISEIDQVIINLVKKRSSEVEEAEETEKTGTIEPIHMNKGKIPEIKPVNKSSDTAIRPKAGKTVRVDIDRLDHLMNLVSELIIIKTQLESAEVNNRSQHYNESIEYLERISTSIHDAVMKVRMVPVGMVFNRFPRMIRDLAKELNKKIELNMIGEETEVDRTVIDEIADPLIHLLRNSADHGIESPQERKKMNKPETGTINLVAYHDGNNVVIEVQDDGAGINIQKVRQKAIEKGLVDEAIADSLSESEIINFLFQPSFSTADKVTDVSGRGVGLDVVKTKVESLGGVIEVETEKGKGSKFIIRFPLTLAIIQALMVVLGEEKYAIPLNSTKEIINVKPEEIKLVQQKEVIVLRNNLIPLIRLKEMLEVPGDGHADSKEITVVIVKKGDKTFGLVVDDLLGQQEIVIKSMSKHLSSVKNFVGATILGDGQVALILDPNALAS